MPSKLPTASEANIQAAIIAYLRYQGFYVQRMNSGAIRTARNQLVRMNRAGTPDIMAFRQIEDAIYTKLGDNITRLRPFTVTRPQLLFIECKKPGNKPTILQSQVMAEMEEHGALCFVATSVEDVERQLAL